ARAGAERDGAPAPKSVPLGRSAMKTWVCDLGQKLEVFTPFLGKYRPFVGRCCQTCTPRSWRGMLFDGPLTTCWMSLSISVPRYRGWLVRRLCYFLAVLDWKVPSDVPGDLAERICRSKRRRVSRWAPGVALWPAEGFGDASPSRGVAHLLLFLPPLRRFCSWALLRLLNRLFLNVQLHRGQLEMVLRAAGTPGVPLVFLSMHKSWLDGVLLSFLLFSQGLGVPRVTVGGQTCSPLCRPGARRRRPVDASLSSFSQHGARPLGLRACLWAACRALRREFGCVRVDFAQPFSLQVPQQDCRSGGSASWDLTAPMLGLAGCTMRGPPTLPEAERTVVSAFLFLPCGWETPLPRFRVPPPRLNSQAGHWLGLLFLQGVFLSRLMADFSWLLEEILLRHRDVGFSGQLRAVVLHSLSLLGTRVALYRLSPPGDVLVLPEASAAARRELSLRGAALLPIFAGEAVGACAIRALLAEMLPFLRVPAGPCGMVLSQDELHRKILALLRLLPPNLLGLQPCQPLECYSQDVLDKLIRCGLLEAEEVGRRLCDVARRPFLRKPPWTEMDFADSDSDAEDAAGKRCFKLSQPHGSPDFLLFLCRLLSPVLQTYARAAAFLADLAFPFPEPAYVDALQRFLAEDGGFACANRSLALSSLRTFKELGVLKEVTSPAGPLLHLGEPFRSGENRQKLEAFIRQFAEP
uniref:Glycerol-3-phosphate acyltransferase 2, mitochondrial n=2 Tax=Apteryx TaxID=8821 RepID=A0A8B9PGY6_APTOW